MQASFMLTWRKLELAKKEGASIEKITPYDPTVRHISDWCGKAQPIVGGDIHGPVVLDSVRKQDEQVRKQLPAMAPVYHVLPPWVSVLTSFGDGLRCGSESPINPFLPNLLLVLECIQLLFLHKKSNGDVSSRNIGVPLINSIFEMSYREHLGIECVLLAKY